MSNAELLVIDPSELRFPFELRKQISCSLRLSNKTDSHMVFKVKTTNPKKYCVRPNTGIILPQSTCDVTVTMQAQNEAPTDLVCRDKFLVQSVLSNASITVKDITVEMFSKESGNIMEESKLRVVFVAPPQPPSPVAEGSEEGGSSPSASISDNNGSLLASDMLNSTSKGYIRIREKPSEATVLISKLTEEKNSALQRSNELVQELDALRREVKKRNSGLSFKLVLVIALLGIFIGYVMNHRT
ncbi:Vesicle-associated protein 1-1 [Zostera marina]|uniref:Vesicle-associated protein 1-1 n=1 Tax=Zostera marina TaxID=29655 RepID=A0A0K9P1X6_ZOSMR|nr:Vesicle-associated protein 1-1 [Zostera marina]